MFNDDILNREEMLSNVLTKHANMFYDDILNRIGPKDTLLG